MSWNYRVIRRRDPSGDDFLAIHEVYYDDDGNFKNVTEEAVNVGSETIEGLKETLSLMQEAFARTIIDWEEISQNINPIMIESPPFGSGIGLTIPTEGNLRREKR